MDVYVLILVLVEHTLGELGAKLENGQEHVLILVLVEHTLGEFNPQLFANGVDGLNPCFSGTYSRRYDRDAAIKLRES